jgi:hypothetical protein
MTSRPPAEHGVGLRGEPAPAVYEGWRSSSVPSATSTRPFSKSMPGGCTGVTLVGAEGEPPLPEDVVRRPEVSLAAPSATCFAASAASAALRVRRARYHSAQAVWSLSAR